MSKLTTTSHQTDTFDARRDADLAMAVDRELLDLVRMVARVRRTGGPPLGDLPAALKSRAIALGLLSGPDGETALTRAGRIWLKRMLNRPGSDRSRRRSSPRGATFAAMVNVAESPLAWLARRRGADGRPILATEQFQAGERLRMDFTFAQLGPRVTADWSGLGARKGRGMAGGAADLRDEVIAAKERLRRALQAVGPDLSGLLLDVCCYLKGLEHVEAERQWPRRSGKVILGLALNALARHYGLLKDGRTARSGAPIGHWGAADYRPAIDAGEDEP